MPRVKGAVHARKRRRKMLKLAKGYQGGRSKRERAAKQAVRKAGKHAFRDRRAKKRTFRRLWQTRLNAAARMNGVSYSRLIDGLKKSNIELDRKVLAEIAMDHPEVFTEVVNATGAVEAKK
ncbi:MAG: 50S ribosomal protein L20 [Candidatus Doudnabacteria bacterium]|nr:50S ribosomal protein L20 [Candidatus Doudnabacteria bacterium]MCA9387562.1 50S ribosomal protein L20 [Candidatus Andersenbacteria bacterium]